MLVNRTDYNNGYTGERIGCVMMTSGEQAFDLTHFLQHLPESPGCYLMYNQEDQVIYVGKAKQLKRRVSSYFSRHQTHPKTRTLVTQITRIEVMLTHTEAEAFILEYTLIKKHHPRYNVIFRDDKSYPYIYVSTHHPFPGLYFYRGSRKKEGQLFGPFPSSPAVHEALNSLQKLFPVRQCHDREFSNRVRPCLQYQIKRCTAPCVGLISAEDYHQDVQDTLDFLSGKSDEVIAKKQAQMQAAADELAFERAAQLRDQITQLTSIQAKQVVATQRDEDVDVIAVVQDASGRVLVQLLMIRQGQVWGSNNHRPKQVQDDDLTTILSAFLVQHYANKPISRRIVLNIVPDDLEGLKAWLTWQAGKQIAVITQPRGDTMQWLMMAEENAHQALLGEQVDEQQRLALLHRLQTQLALPRLPMRMECFDISHLQGTQTIASCVVFIAGVDHKSDYRRYKIRDITPGDDPAAMHQVISRRLLSGVQQDNLPDLMIVDGGKTQLSQAIMVLEAQQLTHRVMLVSIAKGEGRKAGLETYYTPDNLEGVQLAADNPVAHLLQRIRDEAHRFAITGQRKQRRQGLQSALDEIVGVGAKTRQRLLKALGSKAAIAQASYEQLLAVDGITKKQAQAIVDYFSSQPS